jgi:hypothetical protein
MRFWYPNPVYLIDNSESDYKLVIAPLNLCYSNVESSVHFKIVEFFGIPMCSANAFGLKCVSMGRKLVQDCRLV